MKLRHFISFVILLMVHHQLLAGPSSLKDKLVELDVCISEREQYVQEKYSRVRQLSSDLASVASSDRECYDLTYLLYSEYKSFKYDSAYFYANELHRLAVSLEDPALIAESRATITFCYLSSGLFKEAYDMIQQIDNLSNS